MNRFASLLCALLLAVLPLTAAERCAFGVVALDLEPQIYGFLPVKQGAVVDSVWPGSPADKAGVKPGHVITALDGTPVLGRESLSALLAQHRPGDKVNVSLFADGVPQTIRITLTRRPDKAKSTVSPDRAVGGDRVKRPLSISPEIRAAMKEHRDTICRQLAAMPEGLNPDTVIDELQAIRNLAHDANATDKDWMPGKAGEAALQLRDSEGTLQLRGASNSLTLEAYDTKGALLYRGCLDTPEQRRNVPEGILRRLQKL